MTKKLGTKSGSQNKTEAKAFTKDILIRVGAISDQRDLKQLEPPLLSKVFRQSKKITLKRLVSCSLEQQTQVREVRNQIGVRSSMYTEHEIGVNEHLAWISRLKSDKKQIVFAVLNEEQNPIGVVSVNALDTLHNKADWAFYIDENERSGLGAALEYNLIEYVFNVLKLDKLNCEVIKTNDSVVKLHKKFNFLEEGFRRENIEKDGQRIGVHFLGLTKSDWLSNKSTIFEKYKSVINKFSISIEEEIIAEESPLTKIENARSKNNVNWMALLRLSIEQHPNIAKPIVAEILRIDTEISNLTKQLIS
jgi:UDP-4-amino-4,6-dideoxy-N-acetyl-beta-L-altrosamine N-acetyltransferase